MNESPSNHSLDIQDYYHSAKSLRRDLLSMDDDIRHQAAERFRSLSHLEHLGPDAISKKRISLNQAKQVIAKEMNQPDWANLKQDLMAKIEAIEEETGRAFVAGDMPNEAGEVISGDVIYLGQFNDHNYAIDAISIDVYQLYTSSHGPGFEVQALEPIDFDPEQLPDIPEEESQWSDWSQKTAKTLGLS
jgi:hypothetical protein